MVTGLHLQSTSGTDLRYVQPPGSDGSCDQDRSLAGLEVAQRLLAFFLQAISAKNKTRMSWNPGIPRRAESSPVDAGGGISVLAQRAGQEIGPSLRFDEDQGTGPGFAYIGQEFFQLASLVRLINLQ